MRFILPRPVHGWRAFVGEIAIVVIGVLLALGAQQMVESWNWQQKVAAARQTMDEEIRNSLLSVAELDRTEKCSTIQLVALQDAIVRGDQRLARQILERGTAFGFDRLWAENAFQAAIAAQVSDHLGAEKLKTYSQVYQMIREMRSIQETSGHSSADLGVLFFVDNSSNLADHRYEQVREVISARASLMNMRNIGATISSYAKHLGVQVTPREYLAAPGRAENIKRCEADAAAVIS